jgi:hypothetical protein
MRHAAAGVGIGTAARAHLYRTWLTKESRKYWQRVTQRSCRPHRRERARVRYAWADGHLVLRLRGCLGLCYTDRRSQVGSGSVAVSAVAPGWAVAAAEDGCKDVFQRRPSRYHPWYPPHYTRSIDGVWRATPCRCAYYWKPPDGARDHRLSYPTALGPSGELTTSDHEL